MMKIKKNKMNNIFEYTTPMKDDEVFFTQLQHKNIEIKTIVSNTLITPQEFISEDDEWVVILKGCAKIEMNKYVYKLQKGNTLFIPAQTKHTLLKTKGIVEWLAVYIK